MARTYPRTLLDADVKTESERKIFELLEAALSDEWELFHSSSWIARDPAEGADSHEIDLVLSHPDQGALCLEVKGRLGQDEAHDRPRRRVPYLTIHQLALAPDAPREILIDRHDLEDPVSAIDDVLAYHRGARDKRKPLGPGGAAALRELLAPTISIRVAHGDGVPRRGGGADPSDP